MDEFHNIIQDFNCLCDEFQKDTGVFDGQLKNFNERCRRYLAYRKTESPLTISELRDSKMNQIQMNFNLKVQAELLREGKSVKW